MLTNMQTKKLFEFITMALILFGGSLTTSFASTVDQIEMKVSIEKQTMQVFENGKLTYVWPVSTARSDKITPKGSWTAKWLSQYHKSSRYNNAPMPYSIFYNGDFAVHGTDQIGKLGTPASAGCIRLHPQNAEILFNKVKSVGLDQAIISVID